VTKEYPIDRLLRARRILLRGGSEEETNWAYDHLVDLAGIPEPYDGRFPAAAAEILLKSSLAFRDDALRKLTLVLADIATGVGLFEIAELLVQLPKERALKYLSLAEQGINSAKNPFNAAAIAYVQAMHGDRSARSQLIALAKKSEKVPGGYLQRHCVRVLCHFPGNDGEAEWYFREGYRLWVPPEFSDKVDASKILRTLEMIRLPKEDFIVQKCRAEFKLKDERTGISFLRPSGSFITEYGKYRAGWERLAVEQRTAVEPLLRQLTDEEKLLLTRTTGGFYHMDSDGFTLEQLLLGWLDNPAPFRLF